jgi:hypothetical protein
MEELMASNQLDFCSQRLIQLVTGTNRALSTGATRSTQNKARIRYDTAEQSKSSLPCRPPRQEPAQASVARDRAVADATICRPKAIRSTSLSPVWDATRMP